MRRKELYVRPCWLGHQSHQQNSRINFTDMLQKFALKKFTIFQTKVL